MRCISVAQAAMSKSGLGEQDGVTRELLRDALKPVDPELSSHVTAHKLHNAMLQRQVCS